MAKLLLQFQVALQVDNALLIVILLKVEKIGAEDEVRTRDLLLGKEAFYR
jgi:hypothetical protein